MKDLLSLKLKGKFTYPSEFSEVPDGALAVAKNVNLDRDSTLEPRRGFDKEFTAANINKILEYQDKLIIQRSTNTLSYYNSSTLTDYAETAAPVDSLNPIRSAEASENFYFTTSKGVRKLEAFDSTVKTTGIPKGIDFSGVLAGSSGFLTNAKSVAYRVVWGITDANNNLILGAPSQRLIVANASGGTRDVTLTISIPDEITADHFYQVYRSPEADIPNDELQLCFESNPTAGEITAGTLSFTDNLPEDLLAATLYTSPSQEGITQANDLPPLARDLSAFKGHLFYANTNSRHRRQIAILAADGGATPGEALQVDDVITIAGTTFTGKAATDTATRQFAVSTDSSPSIAIRETALELVKVINAADINIYAFYVSGFNDVPGKILLEAKDPSIAEFAITYTPASHSGNPFNPQLPASGTGVSSRNDRFKNGIYFSKFQEPEAVPNANFFRVGSAEDQILRILPLRDSLFIFKEKGGIFRLSGEDPSSFRIDEFDSTVRLIGSETAQKLNNAIYLLSDQGVVQCTETGVTVISRPIENEILDVFAITDDLSAPRTYAIGLAYETERKYILAVPTIDDTANKIHVYNTFTRSWTEWAGFDVRAMHVFTAENKIVLANDTLLFKEKKTYSSFDYADYQAEETILTVPTTTTLTITQADTISAGDVIYQTDEKFSVVSAVDPVTSTITLYFDGDLTTGACTIYKAIDVEVEWLPVHGGRPHTYKHFSEISFVFGKNFLITAEAFFSTETSLAKENVPISGSDFGLWGFFSWGQVTWGGDAGRKGERTYVPQNKSRANMLKVGFRHSIGYSDFRLNGLAVWLDEVSQRFSR